MDKQKADQIITEYLKKIYGFAIKKSYSYDEAEELCAEIVCEVYLSLRKADEIISMERYIWRISNYVYSKYVSSRKKHEGISIDGMQIPYWENDAFEESEEELSRLRREIAFLKEKRRQIVYRFYYEDKSISVIAKEMEIPEGTVKWHLNKAKIELKEGLLMERKIGKLGLSPMNATGFGHRGSPGRNGGPEFYLRDRQNLNIVYSVYYSPKTKEEIAEELAITPVYLEEKINFLEENGFLVKTAGNRYTTYVRFDSGRYSLELQENRLKLQLRIAEILAEEYVPLVREAVKEVKNVYLPDGNRELLEAAAVFYGVSNRCGLPISKDLSKYIIKTTDGGEYIAWVNLIQKQSDIAYRPTLHLPSYWACGDMTRGSEKYPSVFSWSVDTRYSSRAGGWENNLTSDYEYLYEFVTGAIQENAANDEKFKRLKERAFLTADNRVNIMMVLGNADDFFAKIPACSSKLKDAFAEQALEIAMIEAKDFPPQMQDLIISTGVSSFIGRTVALMVMDFLYEKGTFQPLTENEKITSNLIMFSDVLPSKEQTDHSNSV